MFKLIAVLALVGAPVSVHELLTDRCSVEDLYEEVKLVAAGPYGLPETAVFPEFSNDLVEQVGGSCYFIFDFEFTVEAIGTGPEPLHYKGMANRIWNSDANKLEPVYILTFQD